MAEKALLRAKTDEFFDFNAKLFPISRSGALGAFRELRRQAADIPEMTLDEINAEIAAVRVEKKARRERRKRQ